MPKKILPRIVQVFPGSNPFTLLVYWHDGSKSSINLSEILNKYKFYKSLRENEALFRQVKLGEYGTDVVWTGNLDMSANTLWRLAQEQAGTAMTADAFRNWRENNGYTLDGASQALGLSRRTVAYYEQGEKLIPKIVVLAIRGLDATFQPQESKARPIIAAREWAFLWHELSAPENNLKQQGTMERVQGRKPARWTIRKQASMAEYTRERAVSMRMFEGQRRSFLEAVAPYHSTTRRV